MRVVLVGADFEENLGIGMIAAVAQAAGHDVQVIPFDLPADSASVTAQVMAAKPDVVGLGIQFQHRAVEFLTLASALRKKGFAGHVTAGGQFPTLAWQEILTARNGVDSIVLHEGERAFVGLLDALGRGARLADVPGLAVLADDGAPMRTAPLGLLEDLDVLPFPVRYREHARHCGIPFIPLMGSRGCWGSCSYCSITSFYRDARAYGGGKTLRQRTPENVAAEMAVLWHDVGGAAIFCFHDDNFLMPRPEDSLARVTAMRAALDEYGVGKVAMIGKCRPDSVTPELMKGLRELGVLRLYVGVENASQNGSDHLNRRTQTLRVREALRACREAGIFVCYNILLFEPDATLADVRENIAFMREHAAHPVNFCRAEPYYGTPLQQSLEGREGVVGSYLGFNYRIEDDQTELLFRVCSSAFRQRNFDPAGVANRSMGIGYSMKLLEYFYDDPRGLRPALARRAQDLTRAIATETANYLEEATVLVEKYGADHDRMARETVLLGLRIAASDRERHLELDEIYADMEAFGARAQRPRVTEVATRKLWQVANTVALSASLTMWGTACSSCSGPAQEKPALTPPVTGTGTTTGDPNTPNASPSPIPQLMPPDPPPPDQPPVMDPLPPPMDHGMGDDPVVPPLGQSIETQPGQGRRPGHHPRTQGRRPDLPPPPDPVPPPSDPVPPPRPPVMDPLPAPHTLVMPPGGGAVHLAVAPSRSQLVDQWRETTTKLVPRTTDLPLFSPPVVAIRATRSGATVRAKVVGGPARMSLRWESLGQIEGAEREVVWRPMSDSDQLAVAVRTDGGVAVTSIRARDVPNDD